MTQKKTSLGLLHAGTRGIKALCTAQIASHNPPCSDSRSLHGVSGECVIPTIICSQKDGVEETADNHFLFPVEFVYK